jgi:ankyrin repeat protein
VTASLVMGGGAEALRSAVLAGDEVRVAALLREREGSLVLDGGADDADGHTSLILACAHGHEAVTRVLLGAGAAVDAADQRGKTPLLWASGLGHTRLVETLLRYRADVEAADVGGNRAFHLAVPTASPATPLKSWC